MMTPITSPKATHHKSHQKKGTYVTKLPLALVMSTALLAGLSVGYVFYARAANARQIDGEPTINLPDARMITGGRSDGVVEPPPTPTPVFADPALPPDMNDGGDESVRKMMREAYLRALRAPTRVTSDTVASNHRSGPDTKKLRIESDDEPEERYGGGVMANYSDVSDSEEPSVQDARSKFLNQKRETKYLRSTRVSPISRYELKAGSVIPGIMLSGINSDLPGQIHAQVGQDVYDTKDGNFLLIPRGTRLVGEYDSKVIFGQKRVLVKWDRCVFPDASTLELEAMQGADSGGYAGFHDRVNNHFLRMFGAAALMSVISAGYEVSQPDNSYRSFSAQEQLAASMARDLSQLSMEIIRRNLDIQPTLQVRPGYRFHIMVNKDMVLPEAYQREK